MKFTDFWKFNQTTEDEILMKSSDKLNKSELLEIQQSIHKLQKRGYNANKIIKYLQNHNTKLAEKYKAERVFWTELKSMDTNLVIDAGKELDVHKYRVILSPHACPLCVKKTDDGKKTFTSRDFNKSGFGHYPPFHANCYCILVTED